MPEEKWLVRTYFTPDAMGNDGGFDDQEFGTQEEARYEARRAVSIECNFVVDGPGGREIHFPNHRISEAHVVSTLQLAEEGMVD